MNDHNDINIFYKYFYDIILPLIKNNIIMQNKIECLNKIIDSEIKEKNNLLKKFENYNSSRKQLIPAGNFFNHSGGIESNNVIAAYDQGGIGMINEILSDSCISPCQKADVYTELAKYVRDKNPKEAADLALFAWQEEPKPYRMKWLVFRLYAAAEYELANAFLEFLPSHLHLGNNEKRIIGEIKKKALEAGHKKSESIARQFMPGVEIILNNLLENRDKEITRCHDELSKLNSHLEKSKNNEAALSNSLNQKNEIFEKSLKNSIYDNINFLSIVDKKLERINKTVLNIEDNLLNNKCK